MMNMEKLLNKNYGNYLRTFLSDTDSSTTNIRIVIEDERLDPNQSMTNVDYINYDHNSLDDDQVVKKFMNSVQGDRTHRTNSKVQYVQIDFTPLIFQRKLDLLYKQDINQNIVVPLMTKG